jgi:hypothetical protein
MTGMTDTTDTTGMTDTTDMKNIITNIAVVIMNFVVQ